jgi:hypothetical protein
LCENPNTVIQIEKKTNEGKYEFLRSYYTLWNWITKSSPRVIVDTHAGTGIVEYTDTKERIYGSAILAILKTISISKKLTIILTEKSPKNYEILYQNIEDIKNDGISIFEEKERVSFQKKLGNSERKKKIKKKLKKIYPDAPNQNCPKGFQEKVIKSNAEIKHFHSSIEEKIDDILNNYFNDVVKIGKDNKEKIYSVKGIFLVDPCGGVDWEIIQKIGLKALEKKGIELILNWSSQSIYRNPTPKNLSRIFGISVDNQKEVFSPEIKISEYLEIYKTQLGEFWEYIEEVKIPLSTKVKPRKNQVKASYYLLYCTNNKQGISIAKGKMKKIEEGLRSLNYHDISKYFSSIQ